MWLAGSAMLILAVGYLLLVVVAGKVRAGREKDVVTKKDPIAPGKGDRA